MSTVIENLERRREFFSPLENLWLKIQELGGPVAAHTHLDRACTITTDNWPWINTSLKDKWSLVDSLKQQSTEEEILERMVWVVEKMLKEGVRVIGSFIDVDPVVGDKAMKAAERLREEYKGEVTFVFINQTLKGVIEPEANKWFKLGAEWADIVGGLPARDGDKASEHLDIVLETAKSLRKMAHIHVDQLNDINEKETELLARKTIEHGMHGRVVAIHCISLAAHPVEYRNLVYSLMQEAGMMVISCPNAWLNARRKEQLQVSHNSVTPVDELIRYQIPVAVGPDNIQDIYMPFNTGSMMSELKTLLEAARVYDPDELALIATVNGRKVLGIEFS